MSETPSKLLLRHTIADLSSSFGQTQTLEVSPSRGMLHTAQMYRDIGQILRVDGPKQLLAGMEYVQRRKLVQALDHEAPIRNLPKPINLPTRKASLPLP